MINRGDETDRFIDEGIWEHQFDDNSRVLAHVRSMQTGERIAIKAAYTKKHGLPFETWGNTVSVMAIKATGVIAENMGDGCRLRVHWQRVSPAREWYFYTYQRTIWKVSPGDWAADALIDFAFQNKPQDFDRFRNDPFWRERFGTDPKEHKRFRWARFYQAIADGLLSHADDRSRLIAFLQELQPSVEGLGLLSGDQFADGSKGFIHDIDPFTLFGLFNRGIRDTNRQAIASALARFLGVEEAVPESFEGIPVLNNQKSWFFPYNKNRDPAQIEALWQVFQSGLALAEADTEQAIEVFSRDFDAAMAYYGVAWNLTFGLYWCRPWSFLSLDERSRSYIGEKLRLTIGRNGPKHRSNAADYLQLIDALKQRFEEPDFSVHSFPELSLEAWTYTGSAPASADDESEDDVPAVSDGDDTPDVEPVKPVTPYGIENIT
jgi:5-methylcytosine-specific restriction protein B